MATIRTEYNAGAGSKISVNGVKGPDCLKLTEDLLKEKGKVLSQSPTEEMHDQPGVVVHDTAHEAQ